MKHFFLLSSFSKLSKQLKPYFMALSYSALLVLLYSCDSSEGKNSEEEQKKVAPNEVLTQVAIDTARQRNFHFLIHTSGKIEASAQALIKAKISGIVEDIPVQMGERVNKGSILMRFNQRQLLLEQEKAELAYTKALLEFDNLLLGYPSLVDNSGDQKDSLMLRLKVSSGLKEASLNLKEAQQKLADSQIRAPFSGIVYDLKVSEGAYLDAGEELLHIYNTSPLLLNVQLLETEAALLKKSMPVEVRSSQMKEDKSIQGKVEYINPIVDELGLVRVGILLIKPENNTWPGMNATAKIMIPQGKRLLVPKQAVVLRSGKEVVFTFEDGLAKWNYVESGLDNGKEVEILKGLEPEQLVIVTNNLQLAHDAPVAIMSAEND